MFASQEVVLNLGFRSAQERLLALVAGDWLSAASQEAFAAGDTQTVAGPPGGDSWASKLARVRFLQPPSHEHITVVPLRWETAGGDDELVPVLDANIVLLPAGRCARLVVSGSYRPPLGWYGVTAGKRVVGQVAAAMIGVLLRKLVHQLCPEGRPIGW
jgi:hypothetical protein